MRGNRRLARGARRRQYREGVCVSQDTPRLMEGSRVKPILSVITRHLTHPTPSTKEVPSDGATLGSVYTLI